MKKSRVHTRVVDVNVLESVTRAKLSIYLIILFQSTPAARGAGSWLQYTTIMLGRLLTCPLSRATAWRYSMTGCLIIV